MRITCSQILCSDPHLISSLFAFLFEQESQIRDDVIFVRLNENTELALVEGSLQNKHLVCHLDEEIKSSLVSRIELFNFKNSANINVNNTQDTMYIYHDEQLILSVI